MTKFGVIAVSAGMIMATGVSSAYAQCAMPREFSLTQSNGFRVVLSRIEQTGKSFDGSARTNTGTRGDVTGSVSTKGRLKFTVEWDGGSKGIYTGVVDGGNVEDGRTYDATHPANWATWKSEDAIECDDE